MLNTPVALLGGTFDPVHYGHLRFADEVRRALGLPEVRLLPAGDPPHRVRPATSGAHRRAMLDLAVAEFPGFDVDDRELHRAGKSYTVLTLQELRAEAPDRPILLLLGADAFRGLPTWHRWLEVFELASIVVVARPGTALTTNLDGRLAAQLAKRLVTDAALLLRTPAGLIYEARVSPQPVSATTIRARVASGNLPAIAALLPPAVLAYIAQHHLYQPAPDVT